MLREQFLIDPTVAYLNHGSYGACPIPVFEAYQAYQKELETEPASLLYRDFASRIQKSRERLALFLNCQSDQLAFVRNATYGMNMAANSVDLQPGDKVLATNFEYGAVERMWEMICAERGAELVKVKIPLPYQSSEAMIQLFKSQIDSSIKVITFPHISAATAQLFPIKDLVQLAKSHGAISVIDGAHAPGQVNVNLKDIDADFYVGNCHKWMLSPKGVGFVYVARKWEDNIRPPAISWGNISSGTNRLLLENDWQGTTDISPILAVEDSITFLKENQWFNQVIPECSKLIDEFNTAILDVTGMRSLYEKNDFEPPQMRSFLLPDGNHSSLHNRLFHDFMIELPVFMDFEDHFFRVSVQAYNNRSDLERLIDALKELL
ncbi:MAG: aminotransferase class V-fold PLP-dependent enzyme [Verrucomicrobiota bacterium]|nr:aminotransferase class V-fold PLP-dependent enzyme [Verrucomicrobiota bacterium]